MYKCLMIRNKLYENNDIHRNLIEINEFLSDQQKKKVVGEQFSALLIFSIYLSLYLALFLYCNPKGFGRRLNIFMFLNQMRLCRCFCVFSNLVLEYFFLILHHRDSCRTSGRSIQHQHASHKIDLLLKSLN